MKFKTEINGVIDFDEKDVIVFKHGLPGFENLNKFVLMELDEYSPFKILHSIEDKNVGMVTISPFHVMGDYEIDLSNNVIEELNIDNAEDVLVLSTVTLNNQVSKFTTNLRAPIIVNLKNNLGYQIILDEEKYSIKHSLNKE
ncbi:MAG TPA: flagellar assembly protein FliW [Clostridium sp.]|nr:flagellar assembly protein FliW [Clostridium sp.]